MKDHDADSVVPYLTAVLQPHEDGLISTAWFASSLCRGEARIQHSRLPRDHTPAAVLTLCRLKTGMCAHQIYTLFCCVRVTQLELATYQTSPCSLFSRCLSHFKRVSTPVLSHLSARSVFSYLSCAFFSLLATLRERCFCVCISWNNTILFYFIFHPLLFNRQQFFYYFEKSAMLNLLCCAN